MSTNLVVKLGIQIIASSLTMTLGIWGRNCKVTAVEIPQYKEKVSNKITQNTSADTKEKEADIEINIIGELLNEPVFSPFRQEGTVKDSTRPIYVITGEEMEAQGARTVREALKFLPGILGDGTVGTEVNALSGQFIRGSNTG
ncbi:MAG: TonB-dependent receptor plug domain-containing protein, partial [Dolichospermum sp.]